MKRCWKQQKKAEKSVNIRANFDKNKKASRIKALREFTMKRLTDFFGEKGWKTGKMGYNETRKRSKYCCWTVPMSDWNKTMCLKHLQSMRYTVSMRDWHILLFSFCIVLNLLRVTSYLWEMIYFCWIYCFCMNISNASAHKELGHFWCTFPHFLIF